MRRERWKGQTFSRQDAKAQRRKGKECFFRLASFAAFVPLRAILLLFLGVLAAIAQQVGQNAPPEATGTTVIKASTQLVVESVVVKDKKGNPIEGLGAKDFTVTENGVPQAISFCEHQNLPEAPGAAPPAPPAPENITVYDKLSRTRISTEAPGNLRYQDRRLLTMYFDMTAMPPSDQLRAFAAAEKFIRTQMTPADRVSILRYQGAGVEHPPGFHRRPQPAVEHPGDDDCGGRAGIR